MVGTAKHKLLWSKSQNKYLCVGDLLVVSISGLVLFALFIGNIQTYLNSKAERVKEMKSNGQEIELLMDFHSLPKWLKTRFRKYQKYRWQERYQPTPQHV